MNNIGKRLIGRYTDVVPVSLFRMQGTVKASLRERDEQSVKGRTSFDLIVKNGMVIPRDPAVLTFDGPNGCSLRPLGPMLSTILAGFKGKPYVFEIPQGTPIPDDLVLLHEHR